MAEAMAGTTVGGVADRATTRPTSTAATAVAVTVGAERYMAAMLRLTTLGTRAAVAGPAMAAVAADIPAPEAADMPAPAAEAVGTVAEEEKPVTANRRRQEKAMRQTIDSNRISTSDRLALWILSVSLVLGFGIVPAALAQEPGQKTFGSATEATDAFAAAVQNHDETTMLAILGPSGRDVISSGDPVADKDNQNAFVAKYRASHQFAGAPDGRTFLYIGDQNWPTP